MKLELETRSSSITATVDVLLTCIDYELCHFSQSDINFIVTNIV